jgi:hypothetical protein
MISHNVVDHAPPASVQNGDHDGVSQLRRTNPTSTPRSDSASR